MPKETNTKAGAAQTAQESSKKKKRIIIIIVALLLVAAIAFTLWWFLRPQPLGIPVVDENNLADIERELEDKVAKGMFETHMTTQWTFPDGKSPALDAVMGNAPTNNYPFWFTVALASTGEEVYSSSLLPIGTELEEITLDKDLDAGNYAAVLTIHMVDENGEEVESNMAFNITLIVQS